MNRKTLFLTAAAVLVATALNAQSASYTIVGSSCTTGRISPNIGPVPFVVHGLPRIGSTFTIETECSGGYPWGSRRSVFLLTGVSNTAIGGLPLPFDIATLDPQRRWCGLLRTSAEVVQLVPTQPVHTVPALISIPVPSSRALVGVQFFQQVVSTEFSSFGPPFSSVALSAGGQGVIGY